MRQCSSKMLIPRLPKDSRIPLEGFCIFGGNPMSTEGFKRKLPAILSADVAGYCRLRGNSETVRTLTRHREMMSPFTRKHQGRVVDSLGDNLLAEAESILQGVN